MAPRRTAFSSPSTSRTFRLESSASPQKCFGRNENGELGNNTTTNSKSPVDVVGLSAGVVAIDSDVFSSCALMSNGGVKCWGTWEDNGGALILQGLVPVDLGGF